MLDFCKIETTPIKKGSVEIFPEFLVDKSNDIMIRGKQFYAFYDDSTGFWDTNELDIAKIVDEELWKKKNELIGKNPSQSYTVKDMNGYSSGSWRRFKKYVSDLPDNYHQLDSRLTFENEHPKRDDYATKTLPYSLSKGSFSSYDEIIRTLYSEKEREKIEWAIGSVICGDSRWIQKFLVFYGDPGSGKSTILRIIEQLFQGYYINFDAKILGSGNNSFATEQFRSNPLVAIDHDTDLSRVQDNTLFNSIVSHEGITINEKYKAQYTMEINCFLFLGTNKPVKIDGRRSGLLRRLIVVNPTGDRLPQKKYKKLMNNIKFELGAIAEHCKEVYSKLGPHYYDDYEPKEMMYATDHFVNFVTDSLVDIIEDGDVSLSIAWEKYKNYCSDIGFERPFLKKMEFKSELKNYFDSFHDQKFINGSSVKNYFEGFKGFGYRKVRKNNDEEIEEISFNDDNSLLDEMYSEYPAQYARDNGIPMYKWENVKTTLSDLDTSQIHYLKLPQNHIVIDFDLKNEEGEKDKELNLKAIESWPPTYGEFSKGGEGIHLHYIYDGDPDKLSNSFGEDIEIKTYKNPIRRRLSKCNNLPIATINSGLPLKEVKRMINFDTVQTEKGLRTLIKKNLEKEYHPGTKPSVDFIYKVLEDAYNSGMSYDVSDLQTAVLNFASNSTNHPEYCINLVNKMHFKSEEHKESSHKYEEDKLIFYDVEVFPNLFLVNWKVDGDGDECVRMINPKPSDIEELFKFKLVGFNNRRYDNHILYGCYLGYNNEQLYKLSQRIISGDRNAFFREAYNISYTDVYDFASAGNKMGLKKWEIKLGIHHKELGLPWDEPVPEDRWIEVAEYCDNDVIATEVVFHYLVGDWTARKILAELTEKTVNDTTNQLSTSLIFGKNRKPQGEFRYRDLSQPVEKIDDEMFEFLKRSKPDMMDQEFIPYDGSESSILPYFPGYTFDAGKSHYRGELVGEGGWVYSKPGIYYNVALLDVESMHPNSAIDEMLFGEEYTTTFKSLLNARVAIKHKDWKALEVMLDGKLSKYIPMIEDGEISAKDLSNALKTVINSVYGLTSASFENPFRDNRNKDNIVAKRGALFMIDLKNAVEARGFTVAHVKTDSIKIPNASKEIIDFVMDFGKRYGYNFEHEATYDRMCLVNDAVYIAKYPDGKWTATGTQFIHPYVFKKLFSKEIIDFEDMCETKSVKSCMYLDMNEKLPEDEHNYIFVGKVGSFCPIQPGHGGGILLRDQNDKFYSVTGTKGYRWQESEVVKGLDKEQYIDLRYFDELCQDAIDNISQYGDFEDFVNGTYEKPPWED